MRAPISRSDLCRAAISALAITTLIATRPSSVPRPVPSFVWNVSPSVPIGLYAIAREDLVRGAIAAVHLPPDFAAYADARGYLGRDAVLLKPVAATAGRRVCRLGRVVVVDQRFVGMAAAFDAVGRPLPHWRGCVTLGVGDVFLMGKVAHSFDGRYFGVLRRDAVLGRAVPLWTW